MILVVDDDDGVLSVLADSLELMGHTAMTAASGDLALAAMERGLEPDLVLTDVQMSGLNGIELTARIKQDLGRHFTPVIVMTAVSDHQARLAALKAGADDFFSKPVDIVELQARVESLLRISRLHRQVEARNQTLRSMFGRYVSEEVAAALVDGPDDPAMSGGEKREMSVLFADLRGFTPLAESLDPHAVVDILNAYLGCAVDVVHDFGGTVDKFLGDGIMVVFGAPVTHTDDPLRAVSCALRIQERVAALRLPGFPALRLQVGVGINTGLAVAGSIGCERRLDYTVIGSEVNVAQRLEASAGPGQVLISGATYAFVKDAVVVRDLGALRLKGRSEGVNAYDVLRLA